MNERVEKWRGKKARKQEERIYIKQESEIIMHGKNTKVMRYATN